MKKLNKDKSVSTTKYIRSGDKDKVLRQLADEYARGEKLEEVLKNRGEKDIRLRVDTSIQGQGLEGKEPDGA